MHTSTRATVGGHIPHSLGERKVFCVGLSKTGTTSLDRIFRDQLGLHSIHNNQWTDWSIVRNTEMLGRYQAFSDGGCASLRDLDELYPDALFVLNTRPLEKWLLSRHKAVARSRTVARWALTRYVPLGWLARLIERTLLDNRPRAMARWVSVRNSYHRHVLEYFKDRDDKLLVLSIGEGDAFEHLARFLGVERPISPRVANADEAGSITRLISDAMGVTTDLDASSVAVTRFLESSGIQPEAGCTTYFDSDELRLRRSASDLLCAVLPFLRGPIRRLYRHSVAWRSGLKSLFAIGCADLFIRLLRSERDVQAFTQVSRMGGSPR
jgi:hypothetical protein